MVTEQFLDIRHGPTKTVLDRCKILIEEMGKEVILIDSCELVSLEGKIPFYGVQQGGRNKKTDEKEQMWKGAKIPYIRCGNSMPDIEIINWFLQKLRSMAPGWVLVIGGGGILGNLLGKMVPSISIGTVPSELGITCTKYQTLGRKLTQQDIDYLIQAGRTKEQVIEGIFTSSLKPQEEHITKGMLGIAESSFLIAVVGYRLADEITKDFLEMLEEVLQENMHVAFWGKFCKYEEKIRDYPNLKKKSSYFGVCDDILSRMEVSDLYLNPVRKGGGTSCVEAMFQGVPVVTVNYGDVSVNAGKEFCVENYREMQEKILRYCQDNEYYTVMSDKAKKRAEALLDTKTEFVRIMKEAEFREQGKKKKENALCRNN